MKNKNFLTKKGRILRSGLLFLLILGLSGISFFEKAAPASGSTLKPKKEADEILVRFKDSREINAFKMASPDDFDKILNGYKKNPAVLYAEPNYLYQASLMPSDTYYKDQWYLQKIKAPLAWDEIRESPRVVIAVIDSGVQINHPDLKDNIWRNQDEIPGNNIDDDNNGFIDDINGWDFVENSGDVNPKFNGEFTLEGISHGTIIAGIAAAAGNNAAGISGVTWKAQIMPLKVLDGKGEGSASKVIRAIDYAAANGAAIINLSFIGLGYSQAMDEAIKRAYEAGVIIVAAAGNEMNQGEGFFLDETPMYPACHDGPNGENRVIGVAATDTIDQKASFSSFGHSCVDIAAPGISIFSTAVYSPTNQIAGKFFDKYYDGYWSGTSVATPIVSAALALIEEANPNFKSREAVNVLLNSSDNIDRVNPKYINQLGRGRLNLYSAINAALFDLKGTTVKILSAPRANHSALVKITDENGLEKASFLAYDKKVFTGLSLASGDVDGDGLAEIITGAGAGNEPVVKLFDLSGRLKKQFLVYSKFFRGGVNVAVGDVDGDGLAEIITGAGAGGGPHIRIFNSKGQLKSQFFAYDKFFRGGVNVAVGDVDGDEVDEIVVGPGRDNVPYIKIFNSKGQLEGRFFAYDKNFRGGVNVAVGDVDGGVAGKKAEIITGAGAGGGPHIRIFDNQGRAKSQFFAYDRVFRGGVAVAAADINRDGLADIITGAGAGGAPHARVFDASGKLIGSFYAFEENFRNGINVAAVSEK